MAEPQCCRRCACPLPAGLQEGGAAAAGHLPGGGGSGGRATRVKHWLKHKCVVLMKENIFVYVNSE